VAAGAILVMLVDRAVPEATRAGDPAVGLVTILGVPRPLLSPA